MIDKIQYDMICLNLSKMITAKFATYVTANFVCQSISPRSCWGEVQYPLNIFVGHI